MVATESGMVSESQAVETSLLADQQPKNNPFLSLGRQSAIYSLTLDEFQHTLCESGKNFGSMNMDEFLTSIWTAEENQAVNTAAATNVIAANNMSSHTQLSLSEEHTERGIAKQPSLPRQGSLTLPAPLCRKTVDEVWSEIHKGQHQSNNSTSHKNGDNNIQNPECGARQPTFGEMTLEDFLVKAGVVREPCAMSVSQPQPQQQYGLYPPGPPAPVCYGGRVVNGAGGYGAAPAMEVVAPVSPVSSDGNQFGLDMGGLRGRKRIIDGPVEKVVERRQRRMIKNRESAARSRARKQAYTVELEAELNQLREENTNLKQALAELERKRNQQYSEEMKTKVQTKAQKAREKLRVFKRNQSCPL